MKYEQHYAGKGGWSNWVWPVRSGYKHCCCDCGLVHVMQFRLNKRHIEFRCKRYNKATGQVRRWMKKEI